MNRPPAPDRPEPRIAVVGAGLTGLAAAHRLAELGARAFTVFEAEARAGGIVSTITRDGFVLEEGPDAFITDRPAALALAERVGLAGELRGIRPEARRSFVVRRGRLVPTPPGFYLLAPTKLLPVWSSPLFSLGGKLRMSLEPFVPARREAGDESLASFVRRRLGGETLDRIAQAMIGGIYGADPEELSLAATFPRFLDLERTHGSVVRGLAQTGTAASGARYGLFATFARGMQTLTDSLAARLPPGTLRLRTRVGALAPAEGGGWLLDGDRFDAVIVALPAKAAAALVRPFDPALAGGLAQFADGDSVTLSLGYGLAHFAARPEGAGFVVPSQEAPELGGLLGGSFSHLKFEGRAPDGHALVRLFYGDGARAAADEDLVGRARAALGRFFGVTAAPAVTHLRRWPAAMPRYRVGHLDRVAEVEAMASRHAGLVLAGASYRGVGIPERVAEGEAAAEDVLRRAALTGEHERI